MRTNWSPLPDGMAAADRQLVERLRTLKDDSRLTLADLGAKTHYSVSSWERWLNGKRRITRAALLGIAEATRTDAGPLLELLERAGSAPSGEAPEPDAAPTSAQTPTSIPTSTPTPTPTPGPADDARPEAAGKSAAAPAQLPRDIPDYVGREKELELLVSALLEPGRTFVPVWAVVGMGGLGKTSLAVRAAHQAASSGAYPGGTLFLDLRGGTPEPLDADTALRRLLRSAGVADAAIPPDTDDRSALLRSALAQQRTLLVLDNALDAAQVRPLLSGDPGCGVVITSRNQLAGLEGLQRILLGPLSTADSRSLLARIAGGERFEAEPDGCAAILSVCAGLPLALRITGSRLAVRPQWDLGTLSRRLRSTAHRLDELAVDDLAVRTCFESSLTALIADGVELGEVRALRLLGLWEGPEIGLGAAAALLDLDPSAAERELERLTDISLVQSPAPGRYRFHDLLHSFAAERAGQDLDAADRRAAVSRLAAWYAHAAAAASELLVEGRRGYDLAGIAPPAAPEHFETRDEALRWYDAEISALVPITRQAQVFGLDDIAATLPQIFQIYLEARFRIDEWIETAALGLISARRRGSTLDEAHLQTALAAAHGAAGRHTEAMTHSREGMALYEQAGDQVNQARAMDRLAGAHELAGDHAEARAWLSRAIELFEASDYAYGAAHSLNRLGMMCTEAGLTDEAVTHLERCLAVIERLGSPGGRAATLSNLGQAYHRIGQHDRALTAYLAADRLFADLDFRPGQATNLAMMGDFFRETGRPDRAYECLRDSLATLEALDHPGTDEVRGMLDSLIASGLVRGHFTDAEKNRQ